jgi:flagellar biosynthetic protein FliR
MTDTALLNWTLNNLLSLLVIMTRVGPLVFLMPVIGSPSVPTQVKALFTLVLALILVPIIHVSPDSFPKSPFGYLVFVGTEIIFGAVLAFLVRMVFSATDIAGQMVSIAMGMGMAGVIDPQSGTQVSLIGNLWNIIAILIFLAINGHHLFFRTMVESFNWVQPGSIHITDATFMGIIAAVHHMFVLAIQIMAPAAAALFLAHVAMGIIAKTVPQMPVMIVAMPMNIAIGFIFVGLSMSYFLPLMIRNFDKMGVELFQLAKGLGG